MKYLQERLDADQTAPVVLGGEGVAAYVIEQTARNGYDYEPAIVAEVMQLQAEYLVSIGAVDRPVGEDEMKVLRLDDG
jgi:hypothetical protein